ncbi:MAG: hypothetical protein OQJ96_11950 [Flavobacteriales bacterium]|nr:hypothetical protein [Flavobacteriales bacterium]MCW8913859.1 hypothetical protein [Flavobacteriales bacterium]MCW8937975.1 hypothetical protein [Flavobacteriales bacterium]MCW8968400.1 hypothetical protein [Flavobacteriales bacterium]MCW8989646.1 hypothetical protein [Flavobacteriales bacterium]
MKNIKVTQIKKVLKFCFISMLMLGMFVSVSAQNTNRDNTGKSLFKRAQPGTTITAFADVADHDEKTIGTLKDDLSNYHEKIVMIAIDEKNKILKITFTEHMLVEDLQKTFDKHGVTYKPIREPNVQLEQQ